MALPPPPGTPPARLTLHVSPHVREVLPEAFVADLHAAAPRLAHIRVAPDLLAGASAAGRGAAARKAALALATGRVKDAFVARAFLPAAPGEETFELGVDGDMAPHRLATLAGRLYDGERAAHAALALVPPGDRSTEHVHLWATRRLLVTYSQEDFRYHARYAVHGYPTLFSVPALRYAPAPSRASQVERMRLASQGVPQDVIEQTVGQAFDHESFDAGDPGVVTRALASTALQACAMAAGARPFCTDPGCRLFNPHRSPEFLRSLLGSATCDEHRRLLAGD